MRPTRSVAAFALAAALCAFPAAGQMAVEGPPNWAYQMAHDLMSPFCPGRTLAACPSPQADELRQWILLQAAAGRSRDDIEANLYERFGDVILSSPRAEGWGFTAYAIPVGAFLVGGVLVLAILRRLAGTGAQPPASAAPLAPQPAQLVSDGPDVDAELARIVDEEIARQ